MRIYGRYTTSPKIARRKRRDYCIRRRIAMAAAVLAYMLLLGAAHLLVPGTGVAFFLFWGLVVLCVILFDECIFPLRQNDLHTFGFDGRDFAVMRVNGKVKRTVQPEDLEMIHILPAEKPVTRIRYRRRGGGRHAIFTGFGKKRMVAGKRCFIHEPMALLITKEQPQDRGFSWTDRAYPRAETLLYNNIGFVISGGNVKIFLKLLESSTCPVMTNRKFYELHKERMEELFAQAGMNMRRLMIEGDEGK